MNISVVIPAHNEESFIGSVLKALNNQSIPRNEYEIIVIDNNSTDKTIEVAKQLGADKIIKELRQGTNIARQRGVEASKGEIVAFLDADCVPPSSWLENIIKNLEVSNAVAVSGPYDYGYKKTALIFKSLMFLYERFLLPRADKLLAFFFGKPGGVIIGGNFATYRWVIDMIGGLPSVKFWGDDAAIATLISRKVGRVFFDPHLIVKSSSRRFEKEGYWRLMYLYSIAYFKVYFKEDYA